MRTREYSTDELLLIANNVTGEYTDKQVRQAKMELYKRGVDDKVIADIMEEKEEAFMKRLDAAARAEKARMDKQNEKNRNVSYRWWELIPMLLFAPFYLVRGEKELVDILLFLPVYLLSWTPVDFSGLFPELRRLKEEKYDLKFKQRLTALIAGDAMYFLLVYYSRPLKSAHLRNIVRKQYPADFFNKPQKSPHGSFEVVCGGS